MSGTLSKIIFLPLNNISSNNSRFKLIFGEKLAILKTLNTLEISKHPRLIFIDLSMYLLEKVDYLNKTGIINRFVKKFNNLDSTFWIETSKLSIECKFFLANDGFLAIKVNGSIKSQLKSTLDRIFGKNNFVNEIIINSPFKLTYGCNSEVFERTDYILLYSKSPKPRINPVLNDKQSGGYWHSFVSKGQGTAKKFIFHKEEVILSPPSGTHWKLKQDKILKLCSQGKIRLNRKGSPEYWVPLKKGQIIDTNWLDIPSFILMVEKILISSKLYERLIRLCLNKGDIFMNLSLDSSLSLLVAKKLDLNLIGIGESKSNIETILLDLCDNEINLSMYELISKKAKTTHEPKINKEIQYDSESKTFSNKNKLSLVELYPVNHSKTNLKGKDDWENLLVHSDCLNVLNVLLNQIKSQVKVIYIDPPFFTGTDENIVIPVRKRGNESEILQTHDLAYNNVLRHSDPVGFFTIWLKERITSMKPLLREDGFIFVRFDYHFGHYARMVLDEVFGQNNFVNEFLVRRMKKNLSKKQEFRQTHLIIHSDSLFVYRMSSKARLKTEEINKKRRKNQDEIEIQYREDNLWIDIAGYEKAKKTLYPTENSESLLTRIIQIASNKGDIITDFFCGSGTTLAIAEKLERNWIGVDIGHYSVHETKKRILRIPKRKQFSLYSLKTSPFLLQEKKQHQTKEKYLSFKTKNSSIIHLEVNTENFQLEMKIVDFVPYQQNRLFLGNKDSDSIDFKNYIDSWMICWNYESQIFSVDWHSIREIKGKKILKSVDVFASHKYPKAGKYIIASTLIDIFGNTIRYRFNIKI